MTRLGRVTLDTARPSVKFAGDRGRERGPGRSPLCSSACGWSCGLRGLFWWFRVLVVCLFGDVVCVGGCLCCRCLLVASLLGGSLCGRRRFWWLAVVLRALLPCICR